MPIGVIGTAAPKTTLTESLGLRGCGPPWRGWLG